MVKGVDLILRAFNLIRNENVRLELAGVDYGQEAEIKALVIELGLEDRVDYLGPLYGADKVAAYSRADVFIMPSRYEMWGLTFMEALACGTPVVMTDTCEASKILPPECGIVVPLDEMAIAEGMKEALSSNLGNRYKEYRQQWVAQYSWANIAKRIIKLYEGVLNGTNRYDR